MFRHNQPPLIFIVIISYIVIVWSRELQVKTAPNALRMPELFFYKFLEFAAALHRAALQLSMKNMRELK